MKQDFEKLCLLSIMSDHVRKSNTTSPAKRRKTTEKDKNCDIRDYVCSIPMKD